MYKSLIYIAKIYIMKNDKEDYLVIAIFAIWWRLGSLCRLKSQFFAKIASGGRLPFLALALE
jgi:hypothetical protein